MRGFPVSMKDAYACEKEYYCLTGNLHAAKRLALRALKVSCALQIEIIGSEQHERRALYDDHQLQHP